MKLLPQGGLEDKNGGVNEGLGAQVNMTEILRLRSGRTGSRFSPTGKLGGKKASVLALFNSLLENKIC